MNAPAAAPKLYIGLMSGTSADGIDAALVDFGGAQPKLIASHSHPLPVGSQELVSQLALTSHDELAAICELDIHLAQAFADASLALLKKAGRQASDICAIGSHGQTIRHQPPAPGKTAFSLQIGDPNTIAERTGITVAADFRRRDIAAGGHGAPLAPAFHNAVFRSQNHNRAIVNIGGMANVSYLGKGSEPVLGFDTGPGNVLMDAWIGRHHNQAYDRDGAWAKGGEVSEDLLTRLMQHPFLSLTAPKSTGREAFNLPWLEQQLAGLTLAEQDVQASLLEFTAQSLALQLSPLAEAMEVYICGGGAHNKALMQRLSEVLAPMPVLSSGQLGIDPDWVEAMTFAWLAKQCIEGDKANLPSVSGAKGLRILGGIFQA